MLILERKSKEKINLDFDMSISEIWFTITYYNKKSEKALFK